MFSTDESAGEAGESWREHWRGMPEYVSEDLASRRRLIVHFRDEADVAAFAELVGQRITPKQKSLWFPKMEMRRKAHLRYLEIDASKNS